MKKVMAMNGFQELDERELMETEGGNPLIWLVIAGLTLTLSGCGRDPEEETESNSTPPISVDNKIHRDMGCNQYYECVGGYEDCPYH